MSTVQSAAIANPQQGLFIIQRNLGAVRNDRVARPTFPGALGKRYEVLEKRRVEWALVTVLTLIDGGRRR